MLANGVDRQPISTNGSTMTGGPPLARTLLPTRQRRTGWTALGAVLVIGISAAFGYLYSSAGSKEPVVVHKHDWVVIGSIPRTSRTAKKRVKQAS